MKNDRFSLSMARGMARHLLLDEERPYPKDMTQFEAQVSALASEFDAAIADRWIEWKKARKEGWPLDRPLVERIGR